MGEFQIGDSVRYRHRDECERGAYFLRERAGRTGQVVELSRITQCIRIVHDDTGRRSEMLDPRRFIRAGGPW